MTTSLDFSTSAFGSPLQLKQGDIFIVTWNMTRLTSAYPRATYELGMTVRWPGVMTYNSFNANTLWASNGAAGGGLDFFFRADLAQGSNFNGTVLFNVAHDTTDGTVLPVTVSFFALNVNAAIRTPLSAEITLAPKASGSVDTAAPNAPGNVRLAGSGSYGITVAWDDRSDNEEGFICLLEQVSPSASIRRTVGPCVPTAYGQPQPAGSVVFNRNVAGDAFSPTPGVTYFAAIQAFNSFSLSPGHSAGTVAFSNPFVYPIPPPVDHAPRIDSVVAGSSTSATVRFTDLSTNEMGFRVRRAFASTGPWDDSTIVGTVSIGTRNPTDTGAQYVYQDTTVLSDTTYYYRVDAYDLDSNVASGVVSVKTPSSGEPATPTGLAVASMDCKSITLGWDTAAGADPTSISVYRSASAFGPFALRTTLAGNLTSYQDTGLSSASTFYYKIQAANGIGLSGFSAVVPATTSDPGPLPAKPTGLTVTLRSTTQTLLQWTDAASNEDAYYVLRSQTSGGPYTTIGPLPPNTSFYIDTGLTAGDTYYYRVKASNCGGDGEASDEASITMAEASGSEPGIAPITFDTDALVDCEQVASRMIYVSSRDRGAIRIDGCFFPIGLKPQLVPPTLAVGADDPGGLEGTFQAFVRMWRGKGATPSIPTDGSNVETITGKRLVITAGEIVGGTKVKSRDKGVDISGFQIDAATHWEVYLWERTSGMPKPVRVATIPLSITSYTTPAGFTLADLSDGSRLEMEFDDESLIPPACGDIEYYNNRVHMTTEETIRPSDDEVASGATMTVANGAKILTFSGWAPTDALIRKPVYVNESDTGWFVRDVEGDIAYIANADEIKDAAGWQGEDSTNEYRDFSFPADPSTVYRSAFFNDDEGNEIFSCETFPPESQLQGELEGDDSQDPNGCKASRDSMFIFKPSKIFLSRGGAEPDPDGFNTLTISVISRGCGLSARRSMARNRDDDVIIMSDQGPTIVRASGPLPLGAEAGTLLLFRRLFRKDTLKNCCAEWLPDSEYYVVGSWDRLGKSGGFDGIIYDDRRHRILPFDHPTAFTCFKATLTDAGRYQLLAGDADGRLLGFLEEGVTVDLYDKTAADPTLSQAQIEMQATGGSVQLDGDSIITEFEPLIIQHPGTTAANCVFEVAAKRRGGIAETFTASKAKRFTSIRSPRAIAFPHKQMQVWQGRLRVLIPPGETVTIAGLKVRAYGCDDGAEL